MKGSASTATRPTEDRLEQMTKEVICFLQKWGLWQDVAILVNGKRYSDVPEAFPDAVFAGLCHVQAEECAEAAGYTSGLRGCTDGEGNYRNEWVSYANPEHIFDMVYEGALSVLLCEREYETRRSAISDAAWEEIFRKTDLLDRYIAENYEVCSPEDLLALLASGETDGLRELLSFGEGVVSGEGIAAETSAWDPLVFDTWEEYQEFMGWEDEGLLPRYQSFATYEAYQQFQGREWTLEDVMPVWERFLDKAKAEVRKDGELLYCPEMTGHIISEFDQIFERYGLWYDFGFSWSLSCYCQT